MSVRLAGSDWSVNVDWLVRRLLQKLFCTLLSANVCQLNTAAVGTLGLVFCCSEIPETAFYELFRID